MFKRSCNVDVVLHCFHYSIAIIGLCQHMTSMTFFIFSAKLCHLPLEDDLDCSHIDSGGTQRACVGLTWSPNRTQVVDFNLPTKLCFSETKTVLDWLSYTNWLRDFLMKEHVFFASLWLLWPVSVLWLSMRKNCESWFTVLWELQKEEIADNWDFRSRHLISRRHRFHC